MSFYIALATEAYGLLAADTRTMIGAHAGAGGFAVDGGRKLEQLCDGWGTGSGLGQWLDRVFAAIRSLPAGDTDAVGAAIGALRDRALAEFGPMPGFAELFAEQQTLGDVVILNRTTSGFAVTLYDDRGNARAVRLGDAVWNTLAAVSRETITAHFQDWARADSWQALLRRVANLFGHLAALSEAMNDQFGFVLLTADGQTQYLPPLRAHRVLSALNGGRS